jgi:hypothetical protein
MSREDDKHWPQPDRVGKQELEIVIGNDHISFTVLPICKDCLFLNDVLICDWRCADFKDRIAARRAGQPGP